MCAVGRDAHLLVVKLDYVELVRIVSGPFEGVMGIVGFLCMGSFLCFNKIFHYTPGLAMVACSFASYFNNFD